MRQPLRLVPLDLGVHVGHDGVEIVARKGDVRSLDEVGRGTHGGNLSRLNRLAAVDYLLDDTGAATAQEPGDTAGVMPLFEQRQPAASGFAQRVLRFEPGLSLERRNPAADEVLYVLAGCGDAELGPRPA